MATYERDIVNHYNLPTAFPTEWPADLDVSEDEEQIQPSGLKIRRSRSRYSALERAASDRRSIIPGSQKLGDGRANLVQKDEPDPLGGSISVVQTLRNRGLPVEEDTRLRNKFLLSSTTFSPPLFLSQTHSDASTESLLQGLQYLTRSIDQKSASLKVLVESNFERFVRAKATIDNVYTEMRSQGSQPSQPSQPSSRPHSRHVSRTSAHFRNISGSSATYTTPSKTSKKNALLKESDYGVIGIKTPLLEITQKAEDIWGPALGGREREENLKAVTQAIDHERSLYELGANLTKYIKQKDYDAVIEQYNLARTHAKTSKGLAERAMSGQQQLNDDHIHRILITGRMWIDVEEQVKQLKREIWKRLHSIQSVLPSENANPDEHMELISVLLELGVEENPIWVWLHSRYDYLKSKISATSDRSKVEVEIFRRRLSAGDKPNSQTSAALLRRALKGGPGEPLDSQGVIEMWEVVLSFLNKLLSSQNGLLAEVVDLWETTQSFISGEKQKMLPTGFEGSSRHHHKLTESGIRELQTGTVDLINMLRESASTLFADPPVEDISALFSPLPDISPNTPRSPSSAISSALSPMDGRFGRLDPASLPPPSPKLGEAWEDYAFWPPHSNSLSGVHYLSKMLVIIGTAASEMAALRPVADGSATHEKVKALVVGTRERCTRAICAAWNRDAENCKNLEDWTRASDKRDQTKMPMQLIAFEQAVLLGTQKILYISEASTKPNTGDVITPPPTKLLQMVRTQFVTSIYKALSGMVENAEKPIKVDEDEWVVVDKSVAIDTASSGSLLGDRSAIVVDTIDASSRNVRMLLTLSNLKALRSELVPELIVTFESYFSVKLTEESKTIKDVLGQIDSRLFQSYTRPTATKLANIIESGISSPEWVPKVSKPNQVKPYVYNVMLNLVMVHTEVATTTASPATSSTPSSTSQSLTNEILSYLLEAISSSLLKAFSTYHKNYSLPALMQATLDVEFIAQTLSQYATEKASQIQSQIYLELDRRTDNAARVALQSELSEMRGSLKKLRDGNKGVYACFRRERVTRDREGRRLERKVTE